MIVFIAAGLLAGGVLGARFTVLALVLATPCAAALAWLGHVGAQWSALQALVLVVFLQIGYLCGAGLRLFAASLSPRTPKNLPLPHDPNGNDPLSS
jgi:hypothetical protein